GTTGGGATGSGGGGGGMRSLILGIRSRGGVTAGAGAALGGGGSTGARGGIGRGGPSRRGGPGFAGGLWGAIVPGAAAAGRMAGFASLDATFGADAGWRCSAGGATGRGTTLISGRAGLALTGGSTEAGFAGAVPMAGVSTVVLSAAGGSGGGGGRTIFRMPRMRSPLGVVATRPGSAGFASTCPFTRRRTRSTVASSSVLLWL